MRDKAKELMAKSWRRMDRFLERIKSKVKHHATQVVVTLRASFRKPRLTANKAIAKPSDKQSSFQNATTTVTNLLVQPLEEWPDAPVGPRWAVSHPQVDFSGTWAPVVDKAFLEQYKQYLQNVGFSFVTRQVCLRFVGTAREHIAQEDHGRVLHLNGTSPAGSWVRSLVSSGTDQTQKEEFQVIHHEFLDPDQAIVQAESWWAQHGTVHVSWLRNTPRVQGGEFESKRYLQWADDGVMELICESTFHPAQQEDASVSSVKDGGKFKPAFVRWRYRKQT